MLRGSLPRYSHLKVLLTLSCLVALNPPGAAAFRQRLGFKLNVTDTLRKGTISTMRGTVVSQENVSANDSRLEATVPVHTVSSSMARPKGTSMLTDPDAIDDQSKGFTKRMVSFLYGFVACLIILGFASWTFQFIFPPPKSAAMENIDQNAGAFRSGGTGECGDDFAMSESSMDDNQNREEFAKVDVFTAGIAACSNLLEHIGARPLENKEQLVPEEAAGVLPFAIEDPGAPALPEPFETNLEELPPYVCVESSAVLEKCAPDDMESASRWAEVADVNRFQIRGANYLEDKKKVPAEDAAFSVHQACMMHASIPLTNCVQRLPSLKAFIAAHPKHFFLVFNRMAPDKTKPQPAIVNVIVVLVRKMPIGHDPIFDRLFENWRVGTDDYRNSRLKFIPCIREAPRTVKNAVWVLGGERPSLLGKGKLKQTFELGPNYLEVDIDGSASTTAAMGLSLTLSHSAKMTFEEMLVIEGQDPKELPERPLAAWRFQRLNVNECIGSVDADVLNAVAEPA